MVFLGLLVAALPVLGFPPSVRALLLVVSGLTVSVLAYLSSVVYCSNCKKLIDEAEQVLEGGNEEVKIKSDTHPMQDIKIQ